MDIRINCTITPCIMFLAGVVLPILFSKGQERRVVRGRRAEKTETRQADTSLTSSCAGIKRGLLGGAPERRVLGSALAVQHTALPSQHKSCEKQGAEKGG